MWAVLVSQYLSAHQVEPVTGVVNSDNRRVFASWGRGAVAEPHLSCVGRVQACDSGSVPARKAQRLRDIQQQLLEGHHTSAVQQDRHLDSRGRDNITVEL